MLINRCARFRRLPISLIRASRLFVFDTEGADKLTQFCALSHQNSVINSKCLNLLNKQVLRTIPYANRVSMPYMLTAINEYFSRPSKPSILVGHSAISADSIHLTSNLLQYYSNRKQYPYGTNPVHNNIVGYIDTLPLFRKLYPHLKSYKQRDLVKYFVGIRQYNAHNALDDALMLYVLWSTILWPQTKNRLQLLADASVSNLFCVERYMRKDPKHRNGVLEPVVPSGIPKKTINIYPTVSVIDTLYPFLNKKTLQ